MNDKLLFFSLLNYEKDKNPEIFILIKVKSKTAEFDFILAASEYPPPL